MNTTNTTNKNNTMNVINTVTDRLLKSRIIKDYLGFEIEPTNYQTLQELYQELSRYADPSIIFLYFSDDQMGFYTQSLETDKEYEERLRPFTAKLKSIEEKEKREYLRLKKKYECIVENEVE